MNVGGRYPVGGEDAAEEERYRAVRALKAGQASAVPALLACLADPSWRVRKAAVARLAAWRGEETLLPALVAGLAAGDAGMRNACAAALEQAGTEATPALTAALATQDPSHRRFIVEVLGAIGGPAVRAPLLTRLTDDDDNVRAAAAEALGRTGGAEVTEALWAQLRAAGDDLLARVYILDALVRTAGRVELEAIIDFAGDPMVARQVAALLGRTGDARAVPLLLPHLGSGARETREIAAQALAELVPALGPDGTAALARALDEASPAGQALLGMLRAADEAVVLAAVRLLARAGRPELAPRLLAAMARRPSADRGAHAVLAMGRAVVAPLLAAIDEADAESRVLFLEVIEVLGAVEHVADLLTVASGPDPRAAEAALRVVGVLGDEAAIEPLMVLAHREDAELAYAAALALAELGRRLPEQVGRRVRAELERGDLRPEWLVVLARLGREGDGPAVLAALNAPDPAVRQAALEAAAALHEIVPVERIILALADEHPAVRAAAAQALAQFASPASREALISAARDADPWVAAAAVRSLGRVGGRDAVPVLLEAAQASDSLLVIAALSGLFRLNPPELGAAVARGLAHADPEVVREAINAAMRLPAEVSAPLLEPGLASRYWHVRAATAEALAKRRLPVARERVAELLARESEPLARDALQRLLAVAEGQR